MPLVFGSWNSIWKRFWRLSRSGVFETFFEALASLSARAHLVQMFDSTVIRAHVSAAGAKAIVSAICAHAGHELCACLLFNSRFRCWAARR